MKKISLIAFILFFTIQTTLANQIDRLIKKSDFEIKSSVALYVQNEKTGEVLYKKNEQKLLNPASILKTLTFGASYITLGNDYKFETAIYKDSKNNLYLKLAGDTLLTQSDLNKLVSDLKKNFDTSKINNIYIDDTIFDKNPYPNGWMSEDMWPSARMLTPYIIDNNYTQIAIKRSSLATTVDIIQNNDYKLPIINELKLGESNNIQIKRLYGENSSIINLQGTIAKDEIINLPVLKPEVNFIIKLQNALEKNDILFEKKILTSKTPQEAIKISCVCHNIKDISKNILLNSDNFASEIVFKVAGAKYINYEKTATLDDSIQMFNDIYKKHLTSDIKIVDGSGVSRTNFITLEFYNNALRDLLLSTDIKQLLAGANEGTLKDRLIFLENNLKAKTGTLNCFSSIAGSFKTKKQRDIVFSIIIQNSPKRKALLKNFENSLIGLIYKKY